VNEWIAITRNRWAAPRQWYGVIDAIRRADGSFTRWGRRSATDADIEIAGTAPPGLIPASCSTEVIARLLPRFRGGEAPRTLWVHDRSTDLSVRAYSSLQIYLNSHTRDFATPSSSPLLPCLPEAALRLLRRFGHSGQRWLLRISSRLAREDVHEALGTTRRRVRRRSDNIATDRTVRVTRRPRSATTATVSAGHVLELHHADL
jgi:hypothetical protein